MGAVDRRRSSRCPGPRLDRGTVEIRSQKCVATGAEKLTRVLSRSTLLSNMGNPAPSDNVVLRHAVEQIQRCLPSHWSTSVATKTNDVADARLTIKTPAGASAALAIGTRRQLDRGWSAR